MSRLRQQAIEPTTGASHRDLEASRLREQAIEISRQVKPPLWHPRARAAWRRYVQPAQVEYWLRKLREMEARGDLRDAEVGLIHPTFGELMEAEEE